MSILFLKHTGIKIPNHVFIYRLQWHISKMCLASRTAHKLCPLLMFFQLYWPNPLCITKFKSNFASYLPIITLISWEWRKFSLHPKHGHAVKRWTAAQSIQSVCTLKLLTPKKVPAAPLNHYDTPNTGIALLLLFNTKMTDTSWHLKRFFFSFLICN